VIVIFFFKEKSLIPQAQVGNKADAIKIACDFVSLQNLHVTLQLVPEFCQYRMATKGGDDVLSLYDTLYRAYVSLPMLRRSGIALVPPLGSGDTGGQMTTSICPSSLADHFDVPLPSDSLAGLSNAASLDNVAILVKNEAKGARKLELRHETEGIREGMHCLPNVLNGQALVSAAHAAFKCQVTSTETGSSGICERSTFSSLQADLTSATLANPLTRARPAGLTSLIAQQSTSFSSHPKSQMMTSSPKSHHTLICNLRQAYFLGSP
jgi:hypothetical protein